MGLTILEMVGEIPLSGLGLDTNFIFRVREVAADPEEVQGFQRALS